MKVKSLSRVRLLATPWTAAHQAPPSMGFSRQEYWSGVPLSSPTVNYTCLYKAVPEEEGLTHLANLKFESIHWWNHPQKAGLCSGEPTVFWRKEKKNKGWHFNLRINWGFFLQLNVCLRGKSSNFLVFVLANKRKTRWVAIRLLVCKWSVKA